MRKFYIMLAAGLISLAAAAQDPTSEALPFMQLDYNPSSLAMGSTVVSSAATIPFSGIKLAGGLSYQNYMPQLSATQFIGGGLAGSLDKLGYSLSFVHGTGEKMSIENSKISFHTPTEMLVSAGLSYALLDFLSIGVNAKYAKEQPWTDTSIDGLAADVILAGKVEGIDFAAGVTSLGQKVKSQSSGEYNLPTALTLAAGYRYEVSDEHALAARAKVDSYLGGSLAAGAGVEYCWSGMFSARAGYHYGGDSIVPTFASAGLGICFSGLTLDAAYLFASDVLGGTFALSAGFRF